MELTLRRVTNLHRIWPIFAPHHYLTTQINANCRAWVGDIDGVLVAFTSVITMPSGTLHNAWREHRTVVLPDYQGLGLGLRLSEWVGETVLARGGRYYSRTTHPRVGEARNASPRWRATGKSLKMRRPGWSNATGFDTARLAYSHEYLGSPSGG